MKATVIIVVVSLLLLGCNDLHSSTKTEKDVSRLALLKMSEDVLRATVDDHSNVFFIRIEGGLLPIPSTFVLHTLEPGAKLLRAELSSSEEEIREKIYFSNIWVWSNDEKITQLQAGARVDVDHKISKLLDWKCDRKAIVSRNEQQVPGFNAIVSMIFVDIGSQVIAVDSVLEELLTASFEGYARINCSK